MNYMPEIAKMLGVEIGEEFKIEGYDNELKFKFSESVFLQSSGNGWVPSCSLMNVLEGIRKIIKLPKPILDDVEKKYLSKVIRPWRGKVVSIHKSNYNVKCGNEYIKIGINDDLEECFYFIPLPSFKEGTMYKGMKLEKDYSLKDLGL